MFQLLSFYIVELGIYWRFILLTSKLYPFLTRRSIMVRHLIRDLYYTALGSYDAEQTNRSISCLRGAGYPPDSPSMARLAAAHILVRCPEFGVRSFNGSLLSAFVKTSRLCNTASRAWYGRRGRENKVCLGFKFWGRLEPPFN